MQPDTAWKRMKLIEKEVEKLIEKIKPLCVDGKSHEDVCRDYIRQQYVSSLDGAPAAFSFMTCSTDTVFCSLHQEIVSGQKGKPFPSNWDHSQPFPSNWEHSHNNVFLTYRMYYSGTERDTTFPPPEPPKEIVVPASKPKTGVDAAYYVAMNSAGNGGDAGERNIAGVSGVEPEPAEERRQILHEVRLHLDLLKEFEGIIPAETLNKRKRELFAAVPSAPPSTVSRGKLQSMGVAKKPRAEI